MRGFCDCMIGKLPSTAKTLKDKPVPSEIRGALPYKKIGLRLDSFPGSVTAGGHRELSRLLRRGDGTYWGHRKYMDFEVRQGFLKRELVLCLEGLLFSSLYTL